MRIDSSRRTFGMRPGQMVRSLALLLLVVLAGTLQLSRNPLRVRADATAPRLYLDRGKQYKLGYQGSKSAMKAMAARQASALSLASDDFDADGVNDLAVGFASAGGGLVAIHRGDLNAFAPTSEALRTAIVQEQFPSPFLPDSQIVELAERPDFMSAGDFIGVNGPGVVAAARGGKSLYVLARGDSGQVELRQTISVPGGVTALAAHQIRSGKYADVVVGVRAANGPQLLVLRGAEAGLSPVSTLSLTGDATAFAFGNLDGDGLDDVLMIAGGKASILHSDTGELSPVATPFEVGAAAIGRFVFERDSLGQMALLSTDGTVHVMAQEGIDSRPYTPEEVVALRKASRDPEATPVAAVRREVAWQEVESFAKAGVFDSPGQVPLMFKTRIANNGADDVMFLGAGKVSVIAHVDRNPLSGVVIDRRDLGADAVAALAMRVNVDGRPGIVYMQRGETEPHIMMPLPDPTWTVNRFDDPAPHSPISGACNGVANDCSLREAILKSNGDTINLPAGTYTLTRPKVANDYTGQTGTLYVNNSVTIIGAGQGVSIIQGGPDMANGVDMVMAVNEDIPVFTNATASISGVTIRYGNNHGTIAKQDNDGGCMEFDTGGAGTATLSLTNVTLENCTTQIGQGGGIAIFNTLNGAGRVTISNSIIQNNAAVKAGGAIGGGIWVSHNAGLTMTGSQVSGNTASQGAGLNVLRNGAGATPLTTLIHSSTISGNIATGNGGGFYITAATTIDQGTAISGNTSGADGGGIFMTPSTLDQVTLSKVAITGNSAAGRGGGIASGNVSVSGPLSMSFSRLAGNSATTSGANLENFNSTVTATNNWWGTNAASGTIHTQTGSTGFDPFIVLTHTASPNKIKINQTSTLTAEFLHDNHANSVALGNIDRLLGLSITFNGAVLGSISSPQATIQAAGTATATYTAGAVGGNGSVNAVVDQGTATASIIVLQPPTMTKAFSPTTVTPGTPSTLTFSINNGNTVAINGSFTDTLPSGLVVDTTPGVTNTCGGTVTANAGSGTISYSNAASLAVGSCTISVKVSSPTDNVYANNVTLQSSDAGPAVTAATASLTVINPPAISKAFGAATIPLNGTTSLTFTLSSVNANLTLNSVAFTDSLPAGLVVATPGNLANTCSGTATAADGSSSVALSGSSLAPGASCTVSVDVKGSTAGVKNNSVQVSSTNGGTGNTSNASVTVVAPPGISKAFGAATIPLNGSTSLSFTVSNPNAGTTLTGVGFTDSLPAGLAVATPNGLSGSCGGGTITAVAGSGSVSLSGASIAQSGSCTFSVDVTGTAAGDQVNTTGSVTSTQGGTGSTATATVKVVAPPSIAKAFSPTTIGVGATSTLTFTITNPAANTVAQSGVAFSDTLPTGLTVVNGTSGQCGGTLTTTAPTGIALAGGTIAINSNCQFSVTVTGAVSGSYTNTTGTVSSTNGGTGNTASANLTVASPPTISKVFGASTIPLNGSTSLTFTITNPNAGLALNGLAFTDSLPSGLVVATPNSLTNTCSGTATAVAGSGSVSLSAGTVAASGSCTVSVNVTGTAGGIKNNSVQVTSTEGGTGNTSNASVTVVSPAALSKSFGAASIPLNGLTSLSFTVTNNNTTTTLNGIGFSDTLPSGLVVATPNGLSGSCGGGTITATAGGSSISLSGGIIAASGSCSFSVNVTGTAAGAKTNTTGAITSTEGGTGSTATASIAVVAPPSIAKVFNPNPIIQGATTTLTFTITNPAANTVAQSGVAFTDTLPTGLTVANGSSSQCGGTLTTTAPTGISLSGGSIAINSQCQFSVTVTGAVSGTYTNTTGNVASTNGGTGNTASAGLSVNGADLTIAMTHAGNFSQGQIGDTFTLTVSNIGSSATDGSTVTVSDAMPAGFTTTGISGSGWSCTMSPLQCTRADVLNAGGSYPPITIVVSVDSNAGPSLTNTATVSGGGDFNPANNSASNTIAVGQVSQTTMSGAITLKSGPANARNWQISVTNNGGSPAVNAQITGLTLTQTFGAACTPVISTSFPVAVGTIAPASSMPGSVVIDFTGCAATARFRAVATFSANAGGNGGTMTANNQVQ